MEATEYDIANVLAEEIRKEIDSEILKKIQILAWRDVLDEMKYWIRRDNDNNVVGFLHCTIHEFAMNGNSCNGIIKDIEENSSGEIFCTITHGMGEDMEITYLYEISETQYTSYLEFGLTK